MKFTALLLTVLAALPIVTSSKSSFQHFASYFGDSCEKNGDNPMQVSVQYSKDCQDIDECIVFPESNTSGSAYCSHRLGDFPVFQSDDRYLVLHLYLESKHCRGPVKKQIISATESYACVPTKMDETPTQWYQAICSEGAEKTHLFSVCSDDNCNECHEPMAIEEGVCYVNQMEGENGPIVYSAKATCIDVEAGFGDFGRSLLEAEKQSPAIEKNLVLKALPKKLASFINNAKPSLKRCSA